MAASMSPATWASLAVATIFMIAGKSVIVDGSPARTKKSGAITT